MTDPNPNPNPNPQPNPHPKALSTKDGQSWSTVLSLMTAEEKGIVLREASVIQVRVSDGLRLGYEGMRVTVMLRVRRELGLPNRVTHTPWTQQLWMPAPDHPEIPQQRTARVHVCMGVWVCGCMGAWVHGCVGVWVHRRQSFSHHFTVGAAISERECALLVQTHRCER